MHFRFSDDCTVYGPLGIEMRPMFGVKSDSMCLLQTSDRCHLPRSVLKVIAHVISHYPDNDSSRELISAESFVG